jgi:hypothetical protein
MISLLENKAGIFYPLDQGHILTFDDLPPGEFSLGAEYNLNSMFTLSELLRNDQHLGFYFYSGFTVINRGGFIVTYLKSKKAMAQSYRLALRQPKLIVFDFPNVGSLAISTKVSPRLDTIFTEQ